MMATTNVTVTWKSEDVWTMGWQCAHGREARGRGYWAFQFDLVRANQAGNISITSWVPQEMPLGAAKRWACKQANEMALTTPVARILLLP